MAHLLSRHMDSIFNLYLNGAKCQTSSFTPKHPFQMMKGQEHLHTLLAIPVLHPKVEKVDFQVFWSLFPLFINFTQFI